MNRGLSTAFSAWAMMVAEASQAAPIKITVKLGVNPNVVAGGAQPYNKTILKGYTLTATRALSVASAGNPTRSLPSKGG